MQWCLRLAEPIRVSFVTLKTLADARAYILSMSEADQRRPHWQKLAALLTVCAKTGDEALRTLLTYRLQDAVTHPPFPGPDMPDCKGPPAPSMPQRPKAEQRRARRIK
jgi:hypothetical protein